MKTIRHLITAATLATTPALSAQDIVVTGKPLRETEADLKACINIFCNVHISLKSNVCSFIRRLQIAVCKIYAIDFDGHIAHSQRNGFFGMKESELFRAIDENHKSVRGIKEIPEKIQQLFVSAHDVTVDTHVRRLREKLGRAADCVETIRGVGYRFAERS